MSSSNPTSPPPKKTSNLPPPIYLLTVDPPLKQYILHLHTLTQTPPAKSSHQWTTYCSIRKRLLLSYLSHNGEVWKKLELDLCTQFTSTASGYDAIVSGSYHPPFLTPQVFDFVVDKVECDDCYIGVLPGVEGAIGEMVKEWGEENVWVKEDDKVLEVKKGKKRGRKKKVRDDWDSDELDSD
mmetsp:Transcript_21527/g.44890  ORF Transcript_21527/g.44890 Transcript_21527/m.44890 type:complete len:182 (+) Transcript_21527:283-828(+)